MSKASDKPEYRRPREHRAHAWRAFSRGRHWGGLAVLILVVSLTAAALHEAKQPRPPESSIAVGGRLPEMQLRRLDGAIRNFAAYRGKTTIVNVWATWCAPCRAELPSLQRLHDRLDPDRFAVIGISIDGDRDFVREYLRDLGVTYANYLDRTRQLADGVLGVRSYPQTLLIGPDGRLLQRVIGSREWDHPDAIAAIQQP